ncbi:MAG: hypothetical protein KUG77_27355, partial [Nannocystaceae bacterium]|nr:hypothetical protein [Nannocystaceae bacterium]
IRDRGSTTASGTTGPSCGNGVVEGDEACDDGDEDEFDCTAQCTIPACNDRQHNGDETDVDCGATCSECSLCQGCLSDSDCRHTMVCGTGGQCVPQLEMTVDWVLDCGSAVNGASLVGLDAGTYRATARHSSGTLWELPHEPPSSGYFYEMICTGVSFEQMRTPPGQRYIDVDTSFSAMMSETETFEFAGGDLTCWVEDAICGDNNGTTEFSLEYVCGR